MESLFTQHDTGRAKKYRIFKKKVAKIHSGEVVGPAQLEKGSVNCIFTSSRRILPIFVDYGELNAVAKGDVSLISRL